MVERRRTESKKHQPFEYSTPLNKGNDPWIRLLELHPKPEVDEEYFQFTLREYKFDDTCLNIRRCPMRGGTNTSEWTTLCNRKAFKIGMTLGKALMWLSGRRVFKLLWIDRLCTYPDRYRIKHCRNLRLGPLFSEVFDLAGKFTFRVFKVGIYQYIAFYFYATMPPSRRLVLVEPPILVLKLRKFRFRRSYR